MPEGKKKIGGGMIALFSLLIGLLFVINKIEYKIKLQKTKKTKKKKDIRKLKLNLLLGHIVHIIIIIAIVLLLYFFIR